MSTLILQPTETSQWYGLVNEAEALIEVTLAEETESYLVFLLMRFVKGSTLMDSVLALDFLTALDEVGQRQVHILQEIGDKSLLFCGLFPGIADKRRLKLSYFSDIGKAAYLSAGELEEQSSDLFFQLSEQFMTLKKVLQAMRSELHFIPTS